MPRARHGGNVHAVAREEHLPVRKLIDFSASINPLGFPPGVRRALIRAIPSSIHYPDPVGYDLRARVGAFHGIVPESIVLGNGSAELISVLPRALSLRHGLVIGPTFIEFERALALAGAQCTYVHAEAKDQYDPPVDRVCHILSKGKGRNGHTKSHQRGRAKRIDAVFLCNPNSPTGRALPPSIVLRLLNAVRKAQARLIVDEAFVDYCGSRSVIQNVEQSPDLIVLRSFTKFFAIPGIRIGYVVGHKEVVDPIREAIPPWSVNNFAQAAAMDALDDREFRRRSVAFMRQERIRFGRLLRRIPGIRLYPSQVNFFLLELPPDCMAERVVNFCREQRLLVRDCQDFAGIKANTLRLAIRLPGDNDRLVSVLTRAIAACR